MPTTPKFLIPYPDLDAVTDIPADMRLSAERLEAVITEAITKATADAVARIPRIAQGTAAIVFKNVSQAALAVRYPVGLFTATPRIVGMSLNGAFCVSASSNSVTGCNLWLRHIDTARYTGTVNAYWVAIQNV